MIFRISRFDECCQHKTELKLQKFHLCFCNIFLHDFGALDCQIVFYLLHELGLISFPYFIVTARMKTRFFVIRPKVYTRWLINLCLTLFILLLVNLALVYCVFGWMVQANLFWLWIFLRKELFLLVKIYGIYLCWNM